MPPTFVLVPGSHSTSRCFSVLQRELALLGHRSLAVDLPGHGEAGFSAAYQAQDLGTFATEPSPLATATHAAAVAAVTDVVRRAREHGPVVLVGHSRGGMVVTSVANAVPELLARTVYASAWCCVTAGPAGYLSDPAHFPAALAEAAAIRVGDPEQLGVLRMNWRSSDPEHVAAMKRAMLADGTDAELLAFVAGLDPDESLDGGDDLTRADTWGRVPHTYLRFTRDESMPLALQDKFIEDADALTPGNPFDVRSLDASHVGPLVHAAEFAAVLADTVTPR